MESLGIADGADITLAELDLSIRAYKCLKNHGINMLSELMTMTEEDFMMVRNMGRKSREEVMEKIEIITGLRLPFSRELPEN